MGKVHEYALALEWRGDSTPDYRNYSRGFRVSVEGKPDLAGSADPAFRGDPALHNPEDLLLAAASSCHMLSYLALCARAGIDVVRYSDDARGTLVVEADGGGQFSEITLRPRVTVARATDVGRALELHEKAGALCFIARSCNFPIRHEPKVEPR